MNEQQSAQAGPAEPPAGPPRPLPPNRRAMAAWGGVLAGLGAGIGLAALMHVIVQASPQNFSSGAAGSMFVAVVVAGPLIGLGLGLAFAGMAPDSEARQPRDGRQAPSP